MKCYTHNDVEAVAQCNSCGKFLCKECADVFDPPLCPQCGTAIVSKQINEAKQNVKDIKKSAKKAIILMIAAAAFGFLAGTSYGNVLTMICSAYLFGGFVMGCRGLYEKCGVLLAIPLFGWAAFIALAILLEPIILPFELIKCLRIIKEADRAQKNLDDVEL